MYMSPEYKRIKPHSEMASYLVAGCLPFYTTAGEISAI